MDLEQFTALKDMRKVTPMLHAHDYPEGSLVYGVTFDPYDPGRKVNFHTYARQGSLHRVIYDDLSNRVIGYLTSPTFPVHICIPEKRVYPGRSSYRFLRDVFRAGTEFSMTNIESPDHQFSDTTGRFFGLVVDEQADGSYFLTRYTEDSGYRVPHAVLTKEADPFTL